VETREGDPPIVILFPAIESIAVEPDDSFNLYRARRPEEINTWTTPFGVGYNVIGGIGNTFAGRLMPAGFVTPIGAAFLKG
jgi:hypothetical protein